MCLTRTRRVSGTWCAVTQAPTAVWPAPFSHLALVHVACLVSFAFHTHTQEKASRDGGEPACVHSLWLDVLSMDPRRVLPGQSPVPARGARLTSPSA